MNDNRKPHVIMLRAAAVLLILVALSTGMVAGRYARYTTSASGMDSARVARFSVTESGNVTELLSLSISPGTAQNVTVTVANDSEVAIAYTIQAVNVHNNLPLEFQLMDGNEEVDAANLAPGDRKDITLRIHWQTGKTQDSYIGKVDLIRLTVTATQID